MPRNTESGLSVWDYKIKHVARTTLQPNVKCHISRAREKRVLKYEIVLTKTTASKTRWKYFLYNNINILGNIYTWMYPNESGEPDVTCTHSAITHLPLPDILWCFNTSSQKMLWKVKKKYIGYVCIWELKRY